MTSRRNERKAEAFVVCSAVIEGGFPIIANQAVRVFPALYFAGISAFVGAVIHFFLLLARGKLTQKVSLRVWVSVIGVTLCNSVFALLFIFLGTRHTSGINTALLMQSEMLFSFLVFTWVYGQKASRQQFFGAFIVLLGTVCVLYNGSLSFNRGDLFIIFGTLFYPFGNQFAKHALLHLPSGFILMIRHLVGGAVFLVLSIIFEHPTVAVLRLVRDYWWLVGLYGVVVLVVSKLCWYEGLKVLPLTKAIPIILSYPAFSMFFASVFLGETATPYQLAGFGITLAGLSVLVSRKPLPIPPPPLV